MRSVFVNPVTYSPGTENILAIYGQAFKLQEEALWNVVVTQLSCLHIPHSSPYIKKKAFQRRIKESPRHSMKTVNSFVNWTQ